MDKLSKEQKEFPKCGAFPMPGTEFRIGNLILVPEHLSHNKDETVTPEEGYGKGVSILISKEDIINLEQLLLGQLNIPVVKTDNTVLRSALVLTTGSLDHIQLDSIRQVILIYNKQEVAEISFYNRIDGSFILIKQLTGTGTYYIMEDMVAIQERTFNTDKMLNICGRVDELTSRKRIDLLRNAKEFLYTENPTVDYLKPGGGYSSLINHCARCGYETDPNYYCNYNGNWYDCVPSVGICPLPSINAMGLEQGIDSSMLFDIVGLSSFRDNFLQKYEKGQRYTNYYYRLGYFLDSIDYITPNNLTYLLNLGYTLYGIQQRLAHGQSTDIIISDLEAEEIKNFLNMIKPHISYKNIEDQRMIEEIESDVREFKEKTKEVVLKGIE